MHRVPEVIDCWYDSGAMPFAQWGYPRQSRNSFEAQFPADFISEALDQTRGWFYSMLAISTMLFGEEDAANDQTASREFPHPFRNCIVLGLMLAEWWESRDGKQRFLSEEEAREKCEKQYVHKVGKMSKQLRNYRNPQEIFDTYGADALRWYFFANQAPWNSIIYSEKAIKESIPEFLLRLWNIYRFFVNYAEIDGFDPSRCLTGDAGQLNGTTLKESHGYRPIALRSELDRWVLSELNRTIDAVVQRMDAYDSFGACGQLNDFADGLSNWYVRRSRDRFWSGQRDSPDKLDAHWTLYECLLTTSKLMAPFVPFVAETIWQNLAGVFEDRVPESVHLCDFPAADQESVDDLLSTRMMLIREISSLGRSARMGAQLKVRQPLAKVIVILADSQNHSWLEAHDALIKDELNVKEVEYAQQADQYITYQVQPNFKRLGPRIGKQIPALKQALAEVDAAALLGKLDQTGSASIDLPDGSVQLDSEDIQVRLQAKPGWAAAQGRSCVVVLGTEMTDQLVREGLARDLIRLIQERRKEMDCEYTDRIEVGVVTESEELRTAVTENMAYICSETLATRLVLESVPDAHSVDLKTSGHELKQYVKVVQH